MARNESTVDVASLLRELDISISEGSADGSWLLRVADGPRFEVAVAPAVDRLGAKASAGAIARQRSSRPAEPLLVGRTATPAVLLRAMAGEVSVLTAEPLQLVHGGLVYAASAVASEPPSSRRPGRPAWTRWAVERYLLLSEGPARQQVIADALGTTQQAISSAVRKLEGLVMDRGHGLFAPDRPALLEHWLGEYLGPGGHVFGWYSLDPVTVQAGRAIGLMQSLDTAALVSSDVAADVIAPWKLPAHCRIYSPGPVDLSDEGFVPAPLEEATLTICVPRDPTLWRLVELESLKTRHDGLPLADPLIVLWDLIHGGDDDYEGAAEKLRRVIVGTSS